MELNAVVPVDGPARLFRVENSGRVEPLSLLPPALSLLSNVAAAAPDDDDGDAAAAPDDDDDDDAAAAGLAAPHQCLTSNRHARSSCRRMER